MDIHFKGKKVMVLGLSVEGQDSVKFLVHEGADVICADRRTKEELGTLYETLSSLPVTFDLGTDQFRHINDVVYIVRAPGIALNTPELQKAKEKGIEITSQVKLFFQLCNAPIIGVTGTKGKGTTSTIIYEMLRKSGKTVWLGGNVGTPLLSSVRKIKPEDWVVLELSSFQLEDLMMSPHIAVVLRVTQDHLANYDALATNYHETREAYVAAKHRIVEFQTSHDVVIINTDDATSRSFAKDTPGTMYSVSRYTEHADAYVKHHAVILKEAGNEHIIVTAKEANIRGDHNLENIAAATLASRCTGVSIEDCMDVAKTFKGLPYRLEHVGTVGGVQYINDSFSTVPETTIAAIASFEEPLILIVGGSEKGSDFRQMGAVIAKSNVKELIVIGQMTERITKAVQDAAYKGVLITGLPDMHAVVTKAHEDAVRGDVVLLSPGCASFGMFQNYKERGNQFTYEVSKLS